MKVIDNSMLSTFLECPRKWYYRYQLEVQPTFSVLSLPLIFGASFHKAVEEKEVSLAVKAFTTSWAKMLQPGQPFKKPYTLENGWDLVKWFYTQQQPKIYLSEIGFVVPLEKALYGGKIDRLEWNSKKELSVVDFKTTSTVSTPYIEQAMNSKQIKGYVASAQIIGYVSSVGIIRVITVEKPYTITNIVVNCDESDIENWLQSTDMQLDWLQHCMSKNFFPLSGKCGVRWESCPYLGLCIAGKGKQLSKEDCLNSSFEPTPKWEPWYEGKVTVIDQPSLTLL